MSAVLLHALIPDPAALASLGPWLGLAALGVFHGLNPAMGWLFAVALALQRQRPVQLYTATGYIAIGHLASVVIIMAALALAGAFLPLRWVRIAAGAILLGFGCYRLFAVLPAPPVGGHERGWTGPDRLVVPDGVGPRRRVDAGSGGAVPDPTGRRLGRYRRPGWTWRSGASTAGSCR